MSPLGRITIIATSLAAFVGGASAEPKGTYMPGPVHQAEARSRQLCESQPGRVFVSVKFVSECVAYSVTAGNENRPEAVFFFDGDAPAQANAKAFDDYMRVGQLSAEKQMLNWANNFHIRYFYISRLGVQGSSGSSTKTRRTAHETLILGLAAKVLAKRYGIKNMAIAGQSGGSTIGAGMMTMGFNGIKCMSLGSGAFDPIGLFADDSRANGRSVDREALKRTIYNPASFIHSIPADPNRRIFVLGDTQDPKAKFPQQASFVKGLQEAGHHALLSKIAGQYHHGASDYALAAAGGCMNGLEDRAIMKAMYGISKIRLAREGSAQTK